MHPLLEELHQYHSDISVTIHQLQTLLDQVKQYDAQQTDCSEIFTLLKSLRSPEEQKHHRNEEIIRKKLMDTEAPIHQRVEEIAHDHQGLSRITGQLINLETSDTSAREISVFIEDYLDKYFDHMQGEEAIFFPMADKWLTEQQWQEVQSSWQR